jgi:MULE transposase domain
MYGKHPKAIITDQDPAMKKAIELTFPNTVHRCCQWHIMRKAREHFGSIYNRMAGFSEELGSVINRSLTIGNFEKGWTSMVDKFNLHDNNHINVMYHTRAQWVLAYF